LPSFQMEQGTIPVAGSNGIIGYHNKAKLMPPCITIGRSGSVGKVHFYNEPIWAHNTTLFVSDFMGNDGTYVYYLLKSKNFAKLCDSSVVPSLNRNFVYPMETLFAPNIDTQRKIASVLSALDSQIALNRRINARLEQIAKRLYDYWFVQFDFPNADGKPYKSNGGKMVWNEQLKREIPEGWEDGTIGDLFETQAGYAFKSSEWKEFGHPVLTIKNIQEDGSVDFADASYIEKYDIIYQKYASNNGNMIFAMSGNTIGKVGIISSSISNVLINQRVLIIKTSINDIAFPYFVITDKKVQNLVFQLGANSAQPNISENEFRNIKICIPPKRNLDNFNQVCKGAFDRIIKNRIETAALTALRDRLLPLLMNGQVEMA